MLTRRRIYRQITASKRQREEILLFEDNVWTAWTKPHTIVLTLASCHSADSWVKVTIKRGPSGYPGNNPRGPSVQTLTPRHIEFSHKPVITLDDVTFYVSPSTRSPFLLQYLSAPKIL